jgi:hypothetical protein
VSTDLGSVGAFDGAAWRADLPLTDSEALLAAVVEGAWWRAHRVRRRPGHRRNVRELNVSHGFIGSGDGRGLDEVALGLIAELRGAG